MTRAARRRVLMLLENNAYVDDVRVLQEAHALRDAGYDVTVISPRAAGQPRSASIDGVRVLGYRAPRQGDGLLGFLWEYGYSMLATLGLSLWRFARGGFDIVHAHNPPDSFVCLGILYRVIGRCRFVFDHHDLSPELYDARFPAGGRASVRRILVALERLSCRRADLVIATNESYRANAIERSGVAPERVVVVRNGPDAERLHPGRFAAEAREQKPLEICFLGRIGPQDGVELLLHAIAKLVADGTRSDLRCRVVGDGEALPGLLALRSELHLDDVVVFDGWLAGEAKFRRLAAATVCVEPSPRNPYTDRSTAIKLMEYMAFAKPIVAFDLTEHRRSAQDAAVYAEPGDVDGFARLIAALLDDPERCAELGALGRRRIEGELAWSHQARLLVDAYAGLEARP